MAKNPPVVNQKRLPRINFRESIVKPQLTLSRARFFESDQNLPFLR